MIYSMVSDDAFLELYIQLEKAGAALDCITEDVCCSRDKTLSCIASDYITAMGEKIQIMQESRVTVPAA